jgi:hypothetical protein
MTPATASIAGAPSLGPAARTICLEAELGSGAGVPPCRNPRRHFREGADVVLLTSSVAGAPRPLPSNDPERLRPPA